MNLSKTEFIRRLTTANCPIKINLTDNAKKKIGNNMMTGYVGFNSTLPADPKTMNYLSSENYIKIYK